MEKKAIKGVQALAWIAIVVGLWSSFSWTRLLLSPEKATAYTANMNRSWLIFTATSFKINVFGIIAIMLVGVLAGFMMLKKKEKGRKLFIYTSIAFPAYNLLWIMANLLMKRAVSLFVVNIIVGAIFCIIIIKYLNSHKVKECFKSGGPNA